MMEEKIFEWKLQEYILKFKGLYVIESFALIGASYIGVSKGFTGGATGPRRTGLRQTKRLRCWEG